MAQDPVPRLPPSTVLIVGLFVAAAALAALQYTRFGLLPARTTDFLSGLAAGLGVGAVFARLRSSK